MNKVVSFLLLALLGGAASVAALEIVYPADKTWFPRSNYLILKGGEPAVDAITVEVNGHGSGLIDISDPEYQAAFGDFVILEPDFDPGKNRLKVEGFAKGKKVASAVAEVFYVTGRQSPPAAYQPFVMHLPDKEALCAPCHNMNPSAEDLRQASTEGSPCGSCHKRMLDDKYVHGPAGVYQCADCHDPNSKPSRHRPRADEATLCNECHADKVKQFSSNPFVHGPVEIGQCSLCHDLHASPYPAQLLKPVNELCLECHAPIGKGIHVVRGVGGQGHPLSGPRNPLLPDRPFSCIGCHDPHAGKGKAMFVRGQTSRFALCGLCHQK